MTIPSTARTTREAWIREDLELSLRLQHQMADAVVEAMPSEIPEPTQAMATFSEATK